MENKQGIRGEFVLEADSSSSINEEVSKEIIKNATMQENFDRYEKMVYLLRELKDYCVKEKEINKIDKAIAKVKKKQAKYYTPTLLDSSDYKNYIKKFSK